MNPWCVTIQMEAIDQYCLFLTILQNEIQDFFTTVWSLALMEVKELTQRAKRSVGFRDHSFQAR